MSRIGTSIGTSTLHCATSTQHQWREIAATLPPDAKPPPETLLQFLQAVNLYWSDAAGPTPKTRARLLTKATNGLHKVMDNLHAEGSPIAARILRQLSIEIIALQWHAETMRRLTADDSDDPSPFGRAHFHRHEFLAAALELWVSCGGRVGFSRSPRKPGGPLIRYLRCLCTVVMVSDALAARRWRLLSPSGSAIPSRSAAKLRGFSPIVFCRGNFSENTHSRHAPPPHISPHEAKRVGYAGESLVGRRLRKRR